LWAQIAAMAAAVLLGMLLLGRAGAFRPAAVTLVMTAVMLALAEVGS